MAETEVQAVLFHEPPDTVEVLYECIHNLISKEVPRNVVQIMEEIGSGAFAHVHRALLLNDGIYSQPVAVKMLKQGATQGDKVAFLKEMAIMGQFAHPNIIRLFGYVTESDPLFLITELADGSLDDLLQEVLVTGATLLRWAEEIAGAMTYLSGPTRKKKKKKGGGEGEKEKRRKKKKKGKKKKKKKKQPPPPPPPPLPPSLPFSSLFSPLPPPPPPPLK